MLWEISDHQVVITGEGNYAPDSFGDVYTVRCLECPAVDTRTDLVDIFWRAEEGVPRDELDIDGARIVESVVAHLRAVGTVISEEHAAAAVLMASLAGVPNPGLNLLYENYRGGERLCGEDDVVDDIHDENSSGP